MRAAHTLFVGLGLAASLFAVSCDTTSTEVFDDCAIEATLEPAAAARGETVVATGGPFTELYDTTVRVGGVNAEVLEVSRTDCTVCDVCIEEEECSACEVCDACVTQCETCIETVSFRVPLAAPGGVAPVAIINRYGTTGATDFEVLGDTGLDSDLGDSDTDPWLADTGDTGDTGFELIDTGLFFDTGADSDLADTGHTGLDTDAIAADTDLHTDVHSDLPDTGFTPLDTGI